MKTFALEMAEDRVWLKPPNGKQVLRFWPCLEPFPMRNLSRCSLFAQPPNGKQVLRLVMNMFSGTTCEDFRTLNGAGQYMTQAPKRQTGAPAGDEAGQPRRDAGETHHETLGCRVSCAGCPAPLGSASNSHPQPCPTHAATQVKPTTFTC